MAGFEFNKLLGPHVLPPMPPFIKNNPASIAEAGSISADTLSATIGDKIEQTIFGTPQVVPLKVKLKSESDFWLFPVEPLVSLDSKSILITRNVAKKKGRGSIKEYWTEDDWVINVQGILTNPGTENFPDADFKQLLKYLTAKEPLDVVCPALERIGVTRMVISERSLPFTKGPENQNFSFKALSDDDWQLLIKRNTNVL